MSRVESIFHRIENAKTASVVLEGLSQAFGDSGSVRVMNWLMEGNVAYGGQAPVDFMAADPANIPVVANDVAKVLQGFTPPAFQKN